MVFIIEYSRNYAILLQWNLLLPVFEELQVV